MEIISTKKWVVEYDHKDGRKGKANAITTLCKVDDTYGNQTYGHFETEHYATNYDLRYCRESDLHRVMLESYFGDGIVNVFEG